MWYNGNGVIYLLEMDFAFPAIQKSRRFMANGYGNKNAVSATDQDAQYDDKAKRLLGNKIILAHILVKTVDEFRGLILRGAVCQWHTFSTDRVGRRDSH